MDRESVQRLRFDRRLHSRRGWVEESDVTAHIDGLPDVSDKLTTPAELEAEEAAANEAAEPEPEPSAFSAPSDSTAPGGQATIGGPIGGVAGDFSTRSTLGGGGLGGGSFGQDPSDSNDS